MPSGYKAEKTLLTTSSMGAEANLALDEVSDRLHPGKHAAANRLLHQGRSAINAGHSGRPCAEGEASQQQGLQPAVEMKLDENYGM